MTKPLGPYLGRDRLVCKCGHAVDQHPGTWLCTECTCILLEPTATTAHFAEGAYRVACPYCGAEPYHACHARTDNGWCRPPHAAREARVLCVERESAMRCQRCSQHVVPGSIDPLCRSCGGNARVRYA